MLQSVFRPADLLLARGDMTRWSVVACDQYTSEPAYWEDVERFVGAAPSTLRLILPELYLGREDVPARVAAIQAAMRAYLEDGVFTEHRDTCVYVERTQSDGKVRRGLVGAVDLAAYDFTPASVSPLRATEGTVLSRIPPRLAVRAGAPLESPHVMVLIDDPEHTVIEPLADAALPPAYDFDLMQGGGHVTGRFVTSAAFDRVDAALAALADPALLAAKYPAGGRGTLLFAVGDGNHSLATAKTAYERMRGTMPEAEWLSHPARYALVELVNLHDDALEFEPIHRVVFGVDPDDLVAFLGHAGGGHRVEWHTGARSGLAFLEPTSNLPVGSLQTKLDAYLAAHPAASIDYIHGDDVARSLAAAPDRVAFLLPPMAKRDLFPTVLVDGVLPRKTFSMGHAADKRFYLECRRVMK